MASRFMGVFTFLDLHAESTFGWLKHGYDSYKPDTNDIKYLKKNMGKYSLLVFIGTWCDDTHKMLPRLEKVLNLSAYPMAKYTMFGVDREKNAKNAEAKIYRIKDVPTVIVMSGHKEVGRITETVKKSVEKDLVAIIKKDLGDTDK